MALLRPRIFWIAIAVAAVIALVLLREILLPFAIGMVLAFLLVPAVNTLQRLGLSRTLAALILVLVLTVGVLGIIVLLFPAIIGELRFFIEEFPRYLTRIHSLVAERSRPWLQSVMGEDVHISETPATFATAMGSAWLDDALRSLWSGGQVLVSILSLLVVVPIVSIYLLIDWERMMMTVDGWLPEGSRQDVYSVGREIRETVTGFVRGQIVICLILAVFYAAALKLLGLNHAILIGITAGLISFVPYLGAGTGFVVAMCVAVAQFWSNWTLLAVVGSVFLVGETLADYVLSPRIIGNRVKLNPVWLMFALFAFGSLFGFIGLLIAIPLAASLGVVLRFAMRQFLKDGSDGVGPAVSLSGAFDPRVSTYGRAEPGRPAAGPSAA